MPEGVGAVGDAEVLHEFVRARFAFGFVEVGGEFEDGEDVVAHAEFAKDAGFLRQVGEAELGAAVHGQRGDVLAVQEDAATVGADEADGHVEAGGFPRAVRAEQADDLRGVHLVAGVFDDAAFAVVFFEVFGDEHGLVWLVGIGFGGGNAVAALTPTPLPEGEGLFQRQVFDSSFILSSAGRSCSRRGR